MGPASGNHHRGLQSRGPPGTLLYCQPRRSETPHVDSRKVLEGPAELRLPASENAHVPALPPEAWK